MDGHKVLAAVENADAAFGRDVWEEACDERMEIRQISDRMLVGLVEG